MTPLFEPRERGLRRKLAVAIRNTLERQLKTSIASQRVRVARVLVSAGDLIRALPKQIGCSVPDLARHPLVGEAFGQALSDAHLAIEPAQKNDACVRRERRVDDRCGDGPTVNGKQVELRVTLCHVAGISLASSCWLRTPQGY